MSEEIQEKFKELEPDCQSFVAKVITLLVHCPGFSAELKAAAPAGVSAIVSLKGAIYRG